MRGTEKRAIELLDLAGIQLNGPNKWDIQVHNTGLWERAFAEGSLGLGESYMDGWWDVESLDEFICRLVRADIPSKINPYKIIGTVIQAKLSNLQSKRRAFEVGEVHYDLGNDLYTAMLDDRLTYTCGYWRNAGDLNSAQEAKLDLVCKKIDLQPGQHVLDIGCGWGSFAKFAAEKYGARVTGITVSKEQAALGKELCANLPIEIRVQDYRDLNESFDHIISLGMFEHVGSKNYRTYFEVANRCLSDDGLFLLHTIGGLAPKLTPDPWIHKYIFPNGQIPSMREITTAVESLFVTEDVHNFGADYDRTLMSWFANFDAAWGQLSSHYGDRFYRMWKYYLQVCAGAFRARDLQLWQFVLSKHGMVGGYHRISE